VRKAGAEPSAAARRIDVIVDVAQTDPMKQLL
jgi:hypothetical protein